MRTMTQVWILVILPFLGLVIIASMTLGLLGLGNYHYDMSDKSTFVPAKCFIVAGVVRPFSQFKSSYASNCLPKIYSCFEVMWNVTYNDINGNIYSSGVSESGATILIDHYQQNNTYPCWHLRNEVISWSDWTPTEDDLRTDRKMMMIGGSICGSFTLVVLLLGLWYFCIGTQQWPPVFDTSRSTVGYERLA